jgi:hypothetical protein
MDDTGELQDSKSKQSENEKHAPALCEQTDSHTPGHFHRAGQMILENQRRG